MNSKGYETSLSTRESQLQDTQVLEFTIGVENQKARSKLSSCGPNDRGGSLLRALVFRVRRATERTEVVSQF